MSKKTPERVPPKIFLHLARHGKSNKWGMSQELEIAYSNVYGIIRKLLKRGYICVAETKKTARNPWIPVEYYDLTFFGFVTCLLDKKSWKFIDEIANQQAEVLPLIFGKWSFFEEQGIKSDIFRRLPAALLSITEKWENIIRFSEWKQEPPEDFSDIEPIFQDVGYNESKIKEDIRRLQDAHKIISKPLFNPIEELTKIVFFGLPKWDLSSREQEVFLSKLRKDSDLYDYIKYELYDLKEEHEFYLKNINSWITHWES